MRSQCFEDVFNDKLIFAFLTSQPNWWVIVNGAIVGDGKCSSTGRRAMADRTPKGVPSRKTSLPHPEMPVRLDGWALVRGCLIGLSFMVITIMQLLRW